VSELSKGAPCGKSVVRHPRSDLIGPDLGADHRVSGGAHVGVFHYLCMISLSVFGVPTTIGLAYGLTLHALVVGGTSVWAAIAMWRHTWGLRRLAQASQGNPTVS
jgi:hypothetical protein